MEEQDYFFVEPPNLIEISWKKTRVRLVFEQNSQQYCFDIAGEMLEALSKACLYALDD